MSSNDNNRRRALAGVVGIEAWHDSFTPGRAKVDLHADVTFLEGRLGDEPGSQVTFRLHLRRAELVVIVPEMEPVAVDRASVNRTGLGRVLKRTFEKKSATQTALGGGAKLGASAAGVQASISAEASAARKASVMEQLKGSDLIPAIRIMHAYDNVEGCHHWVFEPGHDAVLDGKVWDVGKTPLLKLEDIRADRGKGIAPSVRLQLRCRREDFVISDLTIKDEGLFERLRGRIGIENRMKAAEAYIRNQLEEAGLGTADLGEKFARITLAETTANS